MHPAISCAALLSVAVFAATGHAATLPTKADVRAAAYVGARGGICGDRPCRRDPNIAQVRNVRCGVSELGEVICNYRFRIGRSGPFELVRDVLYRDLATGAWYLDDNDEDIDDVPTATNISTKR